jgi:hypothetical protein
MRVVSISVNPKSGCRRASGGQVTLQYRIRSKYQDQLWRQRVYLCEQLVADAYDRWCRSDEDFPNQRVVAAALFLFSPRCTPFELSPYRLCPRLATVTGTPEDEYRLTWPKREESESAELIAALSTGVTRAVELWRDGRDKGPSSVELAEYLVGEIVARQYVVFHHYETTRRDINHWGI